MNSINDVLRNKMENIKEEDFHRFKRLLHEMAEISLAKLEKANRDDALELIVQKYTKEHAGQKVIEILKKMDHNQMAKDLEKELIPGSIGSCHSDKDQFCSLHGRQELRLFCENDEQLLCYQCSKSEAHKNHRFRPINSVSTDLKKELKLKIECIQEKMKLFEEAHLSYDQIANHIKRQLRVTELQIKDEFDKLRNFLQKEEDKRIAALKDEEWKYGMWKEQTENINREISSLSETIRAIEEQMGADDVTFLKNYKSTVERAQCTLQVPVIDSGALIDVAKHLGNLKFRVWDEMKEIVQYTPVTLDPNTAHPHLFVSDDLTSVTHGGDKIQELPDNPERFDHYPSVLASEGINSGTHCWDVEVGENTFWYMGVMTESLKRKGNYGYLNGDLYLYCNNSIYSACAPPQPSTELTVKQKLQRIRVLLDWDRGKVSFSDPDSKTPLHTLTHTFTERMFPYILIGQSSPLRILPVKASVTVEQHS